MCSTRKFTVLAVVKGGDTSTWSDHVGDRIRSARHRCTTTFSLYVLYTVRQKVAPWNYLTDFPEMARNFKPNFIHTPWLKKTVPTYFFALCWSKMSCQRSTYIYILMNRWIATIRLAVIVSKIVKRVVSHINFTAYARNVCLQHKRKHVDAGATTPTERSMNAWFTLFTCFWCVFTISRHLRRTLPACNVNMMQISTRLTIFKVNDCHSPLRLFDDWLKYMYIYVSTALTVKSVT